jgi:predicted N-acyltransferase
MFQAFWDSPVKRQAAGCSQPAEEYTRHSAIDSIAAAWDRLVPRDLPHLRAGFLRAVERGGMVRDPVYLLLTHQGRPAAAALAYTVLLDEARSAPPRLRRWVDWVRRCFPGFLYRPLRVCGSPISNAECGVYLDPELPADARREVFVRAARAVMRSSPRGQVVCFKDFSGEEVAGHASELEQLGFFPVDPGPGARLELPWSTFGDYLGAMRKRYRRRIQADLRAGEELDFCLLDSFADLAPTAAALYAQVLARATGNLETATERFFAAVSDYDQARLLVARRRRTGEVVGVNLLLFGDGCMHNTYIGFDYAQNERFHTYFNLVHHSLRLALERNCRVCYLGPGSQEFKARLGATPQAVTAYMRHPCPPVHSLLRSRRHKLFPACAAVTHDIFHAGTRCAGDEG